MANVELTETELEKKYPGILEILLIDRTSNKNIIWATSNYSRFGKGFMSTDHIPLKYLVNHSRQIVKPRILKSKTEQKKRSKDMAEVFRDPGQKVGPSEWLHKCILMIKKYMQLRLLRSAKVLLIKPGDC